MNPEWDTLATRLYVTLGGLDTTNQTLIADKGYRRASFETELNNAGISQLSSLITRRLRPLTPGTTQLSGGRLSPIR